VWCGERRPHFEVGRLVEIHGSVIDLRYDERADGGRLVVDCILRVLGIDLFYDFHYYFSVDLVLLSFVFVGYMMKSTR
jgi:hypothetical protein